MEKEWTSKAQLKNQWQINDDKLYYREALRYGFCWLVWVLAEIAGTLKKILFAVAKDVTKEKPDRVQVIQENKYFELISGSIFDFGKLTQTAAGFFIFSLDSYSTMCSSSGQIIDVTESYVEIKVEEDDNE